MRLSAVRRARIGGWQRPAIASTEPDELVRLDMELIAGPVDAFIRTGERTALSYFTRPFTDRMARTFLEE